MPDQLLPAEMITYYGSGHPVSIMECKVRLLEGHISILYEDHEGEQVYSGKALGGGHYELACEGKDGRATLHTLPGSTIYEGFWLEDGAEGMWRVKVQPGATE